MLKRLGLALAGLFSCLAIAQGAGTVPGFSLTPQFDLTGKVMPGCKLAVIQAGTVSTPQIAYQDSALTIPSPGGANLTCDATGRLPQFFLADGLIKLRLTTSAGTQVFVGDNLLVVGPSSGGGGGGGTVDPTTILATGDLKAAYGTSVLSGWVRLNGKTIGSATSGATERGNSDCQALFQYLWGADPNLAVSGGRGVSAAADWAANKTIALPTAQNRAIAGLGDMGNTDAALFAGTPFTFGNSTTLGSRLGIGTPLSIGRSDLPNASLTATLTGNVTTSATIIEGASLANVQGGITQGQISTGGTVVNTNTLAVSVTGNTQSLNGGVTQTTPTTVSPFLLATIYIKL